MKRLFTFWLVAFQLSIFAQPPEGKLYMTTGTGGIPPPLIGYVEYPEETFNVIDRVQLTDFLVVDDKLITATLGDVVIYDTAGYQQIGRIPNVVGRNLAVWNNKLVVTSIANPYLRVYDLQTLNLLFGVDTPRLSQIPTDLLVADNKAFVLLGDSVMIVDLLLEKVNTTLHTPHPFPFGGYNFHIIKVDDDLYITVEYATGALRASLIRMNKLTYAFDSVFHLEGYGGFNRPVLADDRIYLYGFDTYYDITQDSLYLSTNMWNPFAVDYDEQSGALFLHHPPTGINYSLNGSLSDTIMAGLNVLKALFVPDAKDTCTTHNIPLNTGWNMISTYVAPDNPDMLNIIDSISSNILLIKNGSGAVAIPSLNINTIGNWNITEGYKVKVTGTYALTMGCQAVNASKPIPLHAGWSLIAYLRNSPLDIALALNSITGNILLVKDANGNAYIPQWAVNTIGNMIPGQGYQIKMSGNRMLVYPAN